MTVLKKDLATGLELLAEVLTQSTFPQDEIDRQKQSIIASIKAREESPGDIAERRFAAALYPQSPYGRPVEGSEASVKGLRTAKPESLLRALLSTQSDYFVGGG